MKKYNIMSLIIFGLIFVFTFPISVYANSSWHWISETRPHDVLPLVIIFTLFIEILSIYFISKVKNIPKVVLFVMLANILSFLAPYLFLYITPSLYTFEQTIENMPFFIVGIVYLLVTLIVEIPTVYLALRKYSCNSKKLLFTVIVANFVTTILTAIIERVICKGTW